MEKKVQFDNAVELKDLVYAPLSAISAANIRLSSNIVDFLASTGDMGADAAGKPVVQLRTIQMQYEQLRNDSNENTVADCIGLEIPLLSIYPLSSLKVSKTKVSFDAEIRNMKVADDNVLIYTQVCSKKQRSGAHLPRISYEVELEGVPASEGLARFVDTLNAQAIPKRLYSKPIDGSGKKLTGKELEDYNRRKELSEREAELSSRLDEIREMIRGKNNALKLETGMDYQEYTEHMSDSDETENPQAKDLCASIKQYTELCTDLEAQLDEVRKEKLMNSVAEKGGEQKEVNGGAEQKR